MNKGKFIVFEGGEGSGKTTISDMVYEFLLDNNIDCIKTREPGGIKISEQIREVILDKNNTSMDPKTEALLYAAARRQHLVEKVITNLNNGVHVLCDRFVLSSLAYQGYARGLGTEEVYEINKFAIGDCMPDLTLFFDVAPEIGLERISKNKEREVNRLDLEHLDFHHRVRNGYKTLSENKEHNVITINAEKTIQEIFEEVKNIILDNISK